MASFSFASIASFFLPFSFFFLLFFSWLLYCYCWSSFHVSLENDTATWFGLPSYPLHYLPSFCLPPDQPLPSSSVLMRLPVSLFRFLAAFLYGELLGWDSRGWPK
jgi:hypothetical protein